LTFPVTNTTGNDAWLSGWFDYNRDGGFQPGEAVTIRIPNNTTSATLTWTGLPQYLPQGSAVNYGFRFRLSSDQQAATQATGFARDGEVEDYLVPAQTLCTSVTPTISAPQTICQAQPTPLHSSGGSTFSWSPALYLSDPNSADPIASPPITTTYTVTATTPQGCAGNAAVTLTTLPLPQITASNNTTICRNSSITLQASGGISYTWNASDPSFQSSGSSVTVTPPQSTDYYVTGTGGNGCVKTDTISIAIHNVPAFSLTPADTTVCLNSPVKFLVNGGDQYSQYSWTSPSGIVLGTDSSLTIFANNNGIYQVTITDLICQISQILNTNLSTRPLPQLSITSSNSIDCTLGQSTLRVSGALNYQWQAAPGIASLSSPAPVVNPLSTTTYYVQGTDSYSCSSIDSITVDVNDSVDMSKYPVPSAFTPNNDGHNDCFGLKYWGHVTSIQLAVYNRQGQLVFLTNDPAQCWDGTYHGKPQPSGGYVYQIKAATACGIAYRKGIVILVR
jgi:gliding motility-associated-like protein